MTIPDPATLEHTVPGGVGHEERIAMAVRCRDADRVPKVRRAGQVMPGPDGTPVQVMHNGVLVRAGGYHGAWMQDLIARCRGHHEPQEERMFHEVLRFLPPDAAMIELGGFWSYYTVWFLRRHRGRRAVVLEPDPAHLRLGEENARLNAVHPVFVPGFAAGVPSPPVPFETEDSGRLPVPGRSVPDLMGAHGIAHLHLLHCDVQGAEGNVLAGCEALFRAGRVGWVFASTHHHSITGDPLTHQRCLAILRRAGATVVAEHDVAESFSGDGLIVARFGPLPRRWRTPALSRNRYSESLFRNPLYDLALAQAR